jgi:transcription initiation factor TFIIIB Brf1 subunit/transcription initiation factor TFIIB
MDLFDNIKQELEKLLDKGTLIKYDQAKEILDAHLKSHINQNIGQIEINKLVEYYVYSIIDDIANLEKQNKDIWKEAKSDSTQREQYVDFVKKENPEKVQHIFSKLDQIKDSAQSFQEFIHKAKELDLDLDFLLQENYSYRLKEDSMPEEIILPLDEYERVVYKMGLPAQIKTLEDEDWMGKVPMTPRELFNRKKDNVVDLEKELADFLPREEQEINHADLAISGLEIEDALEIPSNLQMVESAIKEDRFVEKRAEHLSYTTARELEEEEKILEFIEKNPKLARLKDFLKVVQFSNKFFKKSMRKKERYSITTLKELLECSKPGEKFNKLEALAELGLFIVWPYDIYKQTFSKKPSVQNHDIYNMICNLASKVRLSPLTTNTALLFYKGLVEDGETKSIYTTCQAAGCVYVASLANNAPISRKSLEELLPHSTPNMTTVSKLLSRKHKVSMVVDPKDVIPRAMADLGLDQYTQNKAYEIIRQANERDLTSSRNPYVVAGGAVYIAAYLSGRRHTQKEVATVFNISTAGVRDSYKMLARTLGITIEV